MIEKYNIIFVVVDALRAQNLKAYGYAEETMPYTRKYIDEYGTVFLSSYSTTDQTDPSFTSIFSGRHPIVHGIIRHGTEVTIKELSLFRKTKTKLLAELLRKQGYITIGIDWLSRWHKRGFLYYGEPHELTCSKTLLSSLMSKKYVSGFLRRIYLETPNFFSSLVIKAYNSLGIYQHLDAMSFIEAAKKCIKSVLSTHKPFFIEIHLWDTHTPFHLPKPYRRVNLSENEKIPIGTIIRNIKSAEWREKVITYHLRGIRYVPEVEKYYNNAIRYVDKALYSLFTFLEDLRIFDNTIIVITGDHGDNLIRDNIFMGHGGLYQRVIKVPLFILNMPTYFCKRIKGLVQHIDIVPTLLDILNIPLGKYEVNGMSLKMDLSLGKSSRKYVFTVSSVAPKRYSFIDDEERFKIIFSPKVEDGIDKYGGLWFKSKIELYDLKKDPDEQLNIAKDNPDLAKHLIKEANKVLKRYVKQRIKLIVKNAML